MTYVLDYVEAFRHVAKQITEVLKGTKPGDIPFYQPDRYELTINLKTLRWLKPVNIDRSALRTDRAISDQDHSDRRPQPGINWPVNLSLTMPMQAWRRSRWHRKSSRQSQEEAGGVTPAGFFIGLWPDELSSVHKRQPQNDVRGHTRCLGGRRCPQAAGPGDSFPCPRNT